MEPTRRRLRAAVLAIVTACAAAGCGTSSSTNSTGRAKSSALPSPFAIVARYGPKSLGLDDPRALAVGPHGDLYVTDLRQRVTVLSPAGRVLRRWGNAGTGPGEFHFVSGDPSDPKDILGKIAVGANGMVYVSDSGNARVEVFTAQGRLMRQFGSLGDRKGQFLSPFDLVVDEAGDVYVLDDQLLTLTKFLPSGKVVWQIGGNGSSDPDLGNRHLHLASIDTHGRLVLVSDDTGRIVYVDRNGHKLDAFDANRGAFPAFAGPCEVTVDTLGYTYASGCGDPAPTLVFDRTHRLVARWAGSRDPLRRSPVFGPNGEVFALGVDGSILRLHLTLAGG